MRADDRLLTYCTNIHPGESWADVRRNLESHWLAVKARVAPDRRFPIGLRVSDRAAREIDAAESERFRAWCDAQGGFVATVNGFPYGRFHGPGVKERVYQPDWREAERAAYTKRLADLLAVWLPAGVVGSISTAPVAFARGFDDSGWPAVRRNLEDVLVHLASLRERRGVTIRLAFEPEPLCVLETTAQAVAFFERMALPAELAAFAGVCFDCCHQAVEFEEPGAALARLADAGIAIAKVQVSSALRARGEEIAALARFDEPSYLHQAVARTRAGALRRFEDLPAFLAEDAADFEECRVHFHVPIFAEHLGSCGTTRGFLEEILPQLDADLPLEVETYSFDALPAELRDGSVADSVARELEWVRKEIDASLRRA